MDTEAPLGREGQTALETKEAPSQEQLQYNHERTAFKTHLETGGGEVPENFADAGAYFDSLKEAQRQYTQARQELSELRKAPQPAPVVEIPPVREQVENFITNELRIPEAVPEPAPAPVQYGVGEEMYEKWGYEFATKGELSAETRKEIKEKTGFSDRMVKDYIDGQKAKLREGFDKASSVVGGRSKLNDIFTWASKNLSSSDMENINIGLASPTYEVTLRGLNAMYQEQVANEKQKEPAKNPNLTQVAASQTGILPYSTHREFKAARSDQKFQYEPTYRELVQQRMAITDWNTLPA